MIDLQVTVMGEPIPQGAVSGGGMRQGKHGGMYHQPGYHTNRKKLDPWRNAVAAAVQVEMRRVGLTEPLDGPLALVASFALERPKTVTREEPCVAPDLDHLVRAVCDALVKAKAIADDSRVVRMTLDKHYADEEQPGVVLTLARIPSAQQELAL